MSRRYDLVIVGMGSGGMVAAELAATLGLRTLVVERHRVGGDCLWTGCVPSKALLASGKVAHHLHTADKFGLPHIDRPEIDLGAVWKRIRSIQHDIATTDDDPDRYRALGVEIEHAEARLVDARTVQLGERRVRTRFVLLCTGSRPVAPAIDGLDDAGYLTSENLFELDDPPRSVVMVGGGPIAIEMAQGFNRLGIRVTVLQKGPGILPRDEPDLVAILQRRLVDEGVDLRLDVKTARVSVENGRKVVHGTEAGIPGRWEADELVVAVGRRPNIEGLGLEEAGVDTGPRGIVVDERMRTSVRSIYAAGDVAGRFLFTHSAAHEGVRAVRDMFFPGKGTVSGLVPWCTFTDPELAHVGMTIAEARAAHGDAAHVHRMALTHSDRARADGADDGEIILVTDPKRRLVGAHILAASAGEMIHEPALAIAKGMRINDLASLIHVYPTLSTSIGQLAADAAFEGALRYRWTMRLTRLFSRS